MACAIAAMTTQAIELNSERNTFFVPESPYKPPIMTSINTSRIKTLQKDFNEFETEMKALKAENEDLRQQVEANLEQN